MAKTNSVVRPILMSGSRRSENPATRLVRRPKEGCGRLTSLCVYAVCLDEVDEPCRSEINVDMPLDFVSQEREPPEIAIEDR